MILSAFGERFTQSSGILELMDDLGRALGGGEKMIMLGGGNPASIPAVNKIWKERLAEVLARETGVEDLLVKYDTPQGNLGFLREMAGLSGPTTRWPGCPHTCTATG
jgi:valine--pyruvate aminotransferase